MGGRGSCRAASASHRTPAQQELRPPNSRTPSLGEAGLLMRKRPGSMDPRLVDKQYHLGYDKEKKNVDFGLRQNNDGTMTTSSTSNQV